MNQVNRQPGGRMLRSQTLKLTYVFPIVLQWRQLAKKGFLIPAALTVLVSTSLGLLSAGPFDYFAWAFAFYCAVGFLYLVYRLCGKRKSWLVLLSAMGLGVLCLYPPNYCVWHVLHVFFANFVGGIFFSKGPPADVLGQFFYNFVTIGLVEEGTKFVPVLLFFWLAYRFSPPWREQIGVFEPLDGLLVGAASGGGFALYETVHQYIPKTLAMSMRVDAFNALVKKLLPSNPQLARLPPHQLVDVITDQIAATFSMQQIIDKFQINGAHAMQVLIYRSLNDLAGHMAWAALLGYALGLAILKPKKGWIAIPIAYCLVAALHAVWDLDSPANITAVISGLASYSLLAAAILQARQLSPNREFNFATQTLERPKTPLPQRANSSQSAATINAQPASKPRVNYNRPAGYAL
ncbi:MAG: PrsW family intramembrane metalloprotease, partial [Candidatus Binataceae bacterium]